MCYQWNILLQPLKCGNKTEKENLNGRATSIKILSITKLAFAIFAFYSHDCSHLHSGE